MSFPRFAENISNVTVTVGRDALLACVVDNLRGFKVSAPLTFMKSFQNFPRVCQCVCVCVGVMDCLRKDYWIAHGAKTPRDLRRAREIEFLCLCAEDAK